MNQSTKKSLLTPLKPLPPMKSVESHVTKSSVKSTLAPLKPLPPMKSTGVKSPDVKIQKDIPDDMKRKIALELSPPDLINFCLTNKSFNRSVCDSNNFWLQKLKIDYPEEFLDAYDKGIKITNAKEIYIRQFTKVSKIIESYMQEFMIEIFGKPFIKYLPEGYKKDLFKTLYQIYLERIEIFKKEYQPEFSEVDLDILLDDMSWQLQEPEGEIYSMIPSPEKFNVNFEKLWKDLEFNKTAEKIRKEKY